MPTCLVHSLFVATFLRHQSTIALDPISSSLVGGPQEIWRVIFPSTPRVSVGKNLVMIRSVGVVAFLLLLLLLVVVVVVVATFPRSHQVQLEKTGESVIV